MKTEHKAGADMKTKQLKAMEIIEFWRLIEFLNQKAFPVQDTEDRKVQLSNIEKINQSKLTIFEEIKDRQTIKEKIKHNEILNEQLPIVSSNFHILVGRMQRKVIIDTLYQNFKGREAVENNTENIAMLSLKVNSEGQYIKESLRVSPLLWGMTICCHYPNQLRTKLKLEEYYKQMAIIEADFFSVNEEENKVTANVLKKLFNYSLKFFVNDYVSEEKRNCATYFNNIIYTRFKNQKEFDKYNDTLEDYSELMMSFFQSDFELVLNKLKMTDDQDDFVNYVTALHDERNQKELENKRKDIRQEDDLLTNILDPLNSPKGKWPSKHSPVLMQQVAINAYLQHEKKIFSVNGPPGTGKTTLLKELIAHNVVERAAMLAEFRKADDAFNTITFKDGGKEHKAYDNEFNHFYELKDDKINDFNLLVASSNNAAVENVTKELPDYTSLMEGIDSKETSEIHELFNQQKQETEISFRVRTCDNKNNVESKIVKRKDIYFTLLSHLLKHNKDNIENKETLAEWGLISAPLGKRANLANYFYQVIMPIINYKNSGKKDNRMEYEKFRNKFKKQYQKVQDMQQFLHEASKFKKRKNLNLESFGRKEKVVFAEIKKYLGRIDNCKKEAMMVEYELKQILPTIKQEHFQFEREKSKLVLLKKDTNILQEKILETTRELASLEDSKKFHEKVFSRFLKTQCLLNIKQLKSVLLDLQENEKLAIITERKQGGVIAYQKEILLEQEQQKVNLENQSQKYQSEIGLYEEQIQIKRNELIKLQAEEKAKHLKEITALEEKGMVTLGEAFFFQLHEKNTTIQLESQLVNPWTTKEYDREREKLFYLALQVNKYFVLTSEKVKSNLVNLGYLWNFKKNSDKEFCCFSNRDRKNCFKALLNTVFLVTPVISTTFASVSKFLADIEEWGN